MHRMHALSIATQEVPLRFEIAPETMATAIRWTTVNGRSAVLPFSEAPTVGVVCAMYSPF